MSIGEALPAEMTRVRDELLPIYLSIGPPGLFAVASMRRALDEARRALAECDVVAMLRVYEELKGFKE
jgi:hypothetical protein